MKICVYFRPSEAKDLFEGRRLSQNIKGALELRNIAYSKDTIDTYDIFHCLSLDDERKINDARERGVPVVFSALMCESDAAAKLLVSSPTGDGYILSGKAVRVLNSVSLVLVNDEYARSFLLSGGVKTPIVILSAGVKLSRFAFHGQRETEIFHNYFQLEPERKYIVTIGDHKNKAHVRTLIELARLLPYCSFFMFAPFAHYRRSLFRKFLKLIPPNVRISPLLSDEVYCSMMREASGYLVFRNSLPAPLLLFEAMAARTPLFAFLPQTFNAPLIAKADAFTAHDITEMASVIGNVLEGRSKNDLEKGFAFAKSNSLRHVGERLVEEYDHLIKKEVRS